MKLAISYFYQIRNFKPNMIPVSTARWDPKWYHDGKGAEYNFIDKNGVVNGLRCEELHGDESCEGLCGGAEMCATGDPQNCAFLKAYRAMLDKLDLSALLERCELASKNIQEQLGFIEEPIIVFIVYEASSNKCSERAALLSYFADNNIDCKELEYPIK